MLGRQQGLEAIVNQLSQINVNGAKKNCTLQLTKKYMFDFERILFKKRRVQFFAPFTFFRIIPKKNVKNVGWEQFVGRVGQLSSNTTNT